METLVLVAMTVLGLAAGPVQAADDARKPAPQMSNAPHAADEKGYVEKAAIADLFDGQSSQLALQKSKDLPRPAAMKH